jgi:hypothetical protein
MIFTLRNLSIKKCYLFRKDSSMYHPSILRPETSVAVVVKHIATARPVRVMWAIELAKKSFFLCWLRYQRVKLELKMKWSYDTSARTAHGNGSWLYVPLPVQKVHGSNSEEWYSAQQTVVYCSYPTVASVSVIAWKIVPVLSFNWAPRHEGVLGKWRYSSMHS